MGGGKRRRAHWLLAGVLALAGEGCSRPAALPAVVQMNDESIAMRDEPRTLSAQDRLLGLARIWSEVKYNYPMWHRLGGLDWDVEFRRRIPQVLQEQSDWDYYLRLQAFAALVRDPHVSVYPPSELSRHRLSPPVRLWYVDDQYVVVGHAKDLDPEGRVALGDAVIAVDGAPAARYAAERVTPYLAAATDHARRLGEALGLLNGSEGTTVRVRLRKPDGKEYECNWKRGGRGRASWLRYEPLSGDRLVTSREVAPGTGYVKISSFGRREVVQQFDKALTSLGEIRGLIVDLRINRGGNSGNGDRIIQRLIDRDLPGMIERRAIYSATLRGWRRGEAGSGVVWETHHMGPLAPTPGEPKFLGRLVLLTSAATGSASEDFVGPLAAGGRATVIGQPTSGSTGNPLTFDLPGGGSFRVCTRYMLLPDEGEFIGMGIQPDIPARPTANDVAAGKDPVLHRAIKELGGSERSQ